MTFTAAGSGRLARLGARVSVVASKSCVRVRTSKRLFRVSLCASYSSSSSNRIQRSHVHDISPCSLTPPSFLIRLAPSGAPIYTGIVASPCTSPRQRTKAPPHSNKSVRPQALLHQASFLLAAMQSRHAHATTMHMPQPAPSTCFLRPAHVACGCIIHGSCSVHA